jgi:hypothetical protein
LKITRPAKRMLHEPHGMGVLYAAQTVCVG